MKALINKILDLILSPLALNINFFDGVSGGLFNEITESIYLGKRPDKHSVKELGEAGITHVVSCLNEEEQSNVEFLKEDFEHLFLGVHDGMNENIADKFPQFFGFTQNLNDHSCDSKCFIHCEAGVSRSPTLGIAGIMKMENNKFYDVFKSVKKRRAQILPNIGFASQLQQLENELLPLENSASPSSLALYLHQVCNFPAEIELIQSALEQNNYNAVEAAMAIFGGEIPRVIQGVKL